VIIYDTFFKPRRLPGWWLRFTEDNPIIPNIIAIAGLAWICLSIAHIISASQIHGHGQMVETLGEISNSKLLIDEATNLRTTYHNLVPAEIRRLFSNLYGNIALYLLIPFLLLLEFLFPCKPSQPLIGKSFLQDTFWFAIDTPLSFILVLPVAEFLHGLFEQYLGFLTLDKATVWPVYLQVIAALLLAEFIFWFNHFVRHKIRTLWLFHSVHHSQKEMNVFTDNRVHIVDRFIISLLTFIPFFIFQVSTLYAVAVIGIYKPIHDRFIHANIKINLGWLGLLITSPQFHRVHHSVESAHQDKNFGAHFSIFDYLFGTAVRSRDIYPQTGIADQQFPTEDKVRISQIPKNLLVQIVYPFKHMFGHLLSARHVKILRVRFRMGQQPSKTRNIRLFKKSRYSEKLK
jgi:sterol desaturase/sphingolipid hydroxylase (fatty acid hydroxylase superfamily)